MEKYSFLNRRCGKDLNSALCFLPAFDTVAPRQLLAFRTAFFALFDVAALPCFRGMEA